MPAHAARLAAALNAGLAGLEALRRGASVDATRPATLRGATALRDAADVLTACHGGLGVDAAASAAPALAAMLAAALRPVLAAALAAGRVGMLVVLAAALGLRQRGGAARGQGHSQGRRRQISHRSAP